MTWLWFLSDLHLEAVPYPDAFDPAPPDFDVLIATGDIYEGDSDTAMRIVARLAGGKPAVFVPGNHEFWGREIERERQLMRRPAERHGITLLDDAIIELAGLRFAGGTLWADGALAGTMQHWIGQLANVLKWGRASVRSPAQTRRCTTSERGRSLRPRCGRPERLWWS